MCTICARPAPQEADPITPKKLPNGRWQIRWRDHTGTQRAQNFKLKADAIAAETRILGDLQRGEHIAPRAGHITLTDWADRWLKSARNLGPGGHDTYRRDLDRYILPALGTTRLSRITHHTIDHYLAAKLDGGLAASSVHRHYRTLRRMLQVAVEHQLIARNPADTVTPPRVEHAEMRFLTPEQVHALHEAIGDRYRAWVHVAVYAGPRWSEAIGLRRANVDATSITITEQLVRRADRQWHRNPPKTRAGRRRITLPSFVADELAHHIDTYANPGPDGLIFPNRNGDPLIGPSFTGNVFKPALRRAGLDPAVRIHDLRHTAVALAIRAGAHPKAIQSRMGHATISVTLDRYGHLFPEMDETLAAGLDQLRDDALHGAPLDR